VAVPAAHQPRAAWRRLAALTVAGAAALGAVACGSGGGGAASGDPAAAVPPGAPVYAEAVVAPQGAQAASLDRLARRILRTDDPGRELVAIFDRAARSRGVTFADDVRPWLGRRVGLAVTGAGTRGRPDAVVVATSRDDAAAAERLAELVGRGAVEDAYRDVELRVDRDEGTAGAVLDGFVLLGSERAVRAAIDAVKGDALAGTDRFERARDELGGDGVGFAFADVRALLRARPAGGGASGALLGPLAEALPEWVAARVRAEPRAIVADVAAAGGRAGSVLAGDGAARAVAGVPGDAWLAVGLSDVGDSLTSLLDAVGASGLGKLGVAQVEEQVRRATGLDLREDVLAWMGDAALFVAGDRVTGLGGALVVTSTDAAASARAIRGLGGLLRGPGGAAAAVRELDRPAIDAGWAIRGAGDRELLVAAAGPKVVVAVGRPALQAALRPGRELGATAAFRRAAVGLGGGLRPSLYLDLRAVAGLLGEHREHARVRRHLAAFGPLVGAARQDGDLTRARLRAEVE
jgi:hypothetical protein